MYKIPLLDKNVPKAYAAKYSAKLLPIIQLFLSGETITVPVVNRTSVVVGVQTGSLTYRWLKRLSDAAYLEKYLLWTPKQQLKYINKLGQCKTYPQEFIFKKIQASIYDRHQMASATHPIDHFNTIFYEIFVNRLYDSTVKPAPFDKWEFISNTGLSICPYCGMEFIRPSGKTKKQIDHFFPKSKYPFYALSYYNLIPSCDACNESPNKGQNDPIEKKNRGYEIKHPYLMNGGIVRFSIELKNVGVFSDDNLSVLVGYKEKALLDGYNLFFDISDRYAVRNIEAGNLYRSQLKYKKSKNFYEGMKIDKVWLDEAYDDLFHFEPANNNPWSQELFRMKVDLFEQLYKLRKPDNFYTKRSEPHKEILE